MKRAAATSSRNARRLRARDEVKCARLSCSYRITLNHGVLFAVKTTKAMAGLALAPEQMRRERSAPDVACASPCGPHLFVVVLHETFVAA
jgi:hypothetical protein